MHYPLPIWELYLIIANYVIRTLYYILSAQGKGVIPALKDKPGYEGSNSYQVTWCDDSQDSAIMINYCIQTYLARAHGGIPCYSVELTRLG